MECDRTENCCKRDGQFTKRGVKDTGVGHVVVACVGKHLNTQLICPESDHTSLSDYLLMYMQSLQYTLL